MNIRQAEPKDVGDIAYMILRWAQSELPEEVRIMPADAYQAERTAHMIVFMPDYHTRVMENNGNLVGAYVIMRFQTGTFGDEPYGSLLGVYVKPEYRGHRFFGLGLIQDAQREAAKIGLTRLEVNPMVKHRNMPRVLQRLGYAPLCVTYMKRIRL